MDWRVEAERLWREGHSWTEITGKLQPCFPALTFPQAREKIRRYIRDTGAYKDKQLARAGGVAPMGHDLTPEQLLRLHGLDPASWTIRDCTSNFYDSQQKGGKPVMLYQCKLTAQPRRQ